MKKLITIGLFLILFCSQCYGGWLSPTSYNDPSSNWEQETNAYDGYEDTFATATCEPLGNTGYLELIIPATNCDKIWFWANTIDASEGCNVDVYYDDGWVNIHTGAFDLNQWFEVAVGATESITKMRFRAQSDDEADGGGLDLYEAEFNMVGGGGVSEDDVVAWWKLEEGAADTDVVDSGPLGLTGVASTNTSNLSVTGKINDAFEFIDPADPNEYVTLTDTGSDLQFESGSQDFTICAWLKIPDNLGAIDTIFDYRDADNDGWRFVLVNGYPWLQIDTKDVKADAADAMGDNAWHFAVAVAYRTGNGRIYIDGVHSVGTDSAISGEVMAITTTAPILGMDSYAAANHFNGIIDEIMVFDKVLSEADILWLYNDGDGRKGFMSIGAVMAYHYKQMRRR